MEQYYHTQMEIDDATNDELLQPDHSDYITTEWMPAKDTKPMFQCLLAEKHLDSATHAQLAELLQEYDDRYSKEWADTGLIEGVH